MAKRHHHMMRQDERASRHMKESGSMRMGYQGDAADLSERTRSMEDDYMIHEDRNQIANLPQEVMIKAYERTGPYLPEELDDTIRGVDHQMDMDNRQRARFNVPKKV